MNPEVSVVMPVYNGERYLSESVESILNQTFENFEFIIIDDGSSDHTQEIIRNYQAKDSRVILVTNDENIGLTKSLNKGLALARAEYLARMDADDVCLPQRLERQISYMSAHPEIGVLGTNKRTIDSEGSCLKEGTPIPILPGFVGWMLLFHNQVVHSSQMIKKQYLDIVKGYDVSRQTAQDYDLLVRLSAIAKISNLDEVLILFRLHASSVSSIKAEEQRETSYHIRQEAIRRLTGINPTIAELKVIDQYYSNDKAIAQNSMRLLLRMYKAYSKDNNLTSIERMSVCHHVGKKIFDIFASNRHYKQMWPYLLWAIWLQPHYIARGIKAIGRKLPGIFGYAM